MAAGGPVNLIKLAVGVEDVGHLARIQEARRDAARAAGLPAIARHVTRSRPKRAADVIAGGCMFWVIRGLIQVRQRILEIDEIAAEDGTKKCAIGLGEQLVRVAPRACRPFQGWRYLEAKDAPEDLPEDRGANEMPPELAAELRDLGLL